MWKTKYNRILKNCVVQGLERKIIALEALKPLETTFTTAPMETVAVALSISTSRYGNCFRPFLKEMAHIASPKKDHLGLRQNFLAPNTGYRNRTRAGDH